MILGSLICLVIFSGVIFSVFSEWKNPKIKVSCRQDGNQIFVAIENLAHNSRTIILEVKVRTNVKNEFKAVQKVDLEPYFTHKDLAFDFDQPKYRMLEPDEYITDHRVIVSRYNQLCELGRDLDFGKDPKKLFPINKPPFYIIEQRPILFDHPAGLWINEKAQVLDEKYQVIPGLFSGGSNAGPQPVTLKNALVFGYIAGKNAVKG